MVLPVQPLSGVYSEGLDAAVEQALSHRAPGVRWVFPPALDRIVARSPALGIQIRGLAVSSFRRSEVRRIGDPLFGDLRRLGAIADTRYALLPVAGGYVDRDDEEGRVEIAVALIDTLGGTVLWYGVVGGEPGERGEPGTTMSAAEALAKTLFPERDH